MDQETIRLLITALVGPASALAAVWLTSWLTERRGKRDRIRDATLEAIADTRKITMAQLAWLAARLSGNPNDPAIKRFEELDAPESNIALLGDAELIEEYMALVVEITSRPVVRVAMPAQADLERLALIQFRIDRALGDQRDRVLEDQPVAKVTREPESDQEVARRMSEAFASGAKRGPGTDKVGR